MTKRLFDLAMAIPALILFSPVFLVIAAVSLVSNGFPVLFRQVRIGKDFEPFTLYKFRTMTDSETGPQITSAGDPRVTRIGGRLRATKLDELPQLFNVIKGDMSLVGPRPEVPKYVERFRDDFATILTVRPGITGAGSVAFRNESEILGEADDPERTYTESVLPDKIAIEIDYVETRSMVGDIRLLIATIGGIFD